MAGAHVYHSRVSGVAASCDYIRSGSAFSIFSRSQLVMFFLTPHAVSLSAFVETLPAHIFSTRCGGDRLFRAAVRAHPLAIDQIGACQAVPPCVNTRASTQRAIRPFQSFICRGRRLGEPTLREAPVELVQRANGPPG